jgi:uncharacterized repeat protein (TIGR03803 family)
MFELERIDQSLGVRTSGAGASHQWVPLRDNILRRGARRRYGLQDQHRGTLTTLFSFCPLVNQFGYGTDGERPDRGLVQASNGNFYGTASVGGANDYGTVFKITPSGTLTTLYNFCSQSGCADGTSPVAELIQATNGSLTEQRTVVAPTPGARSSKSHPAARCRRCTASARTAPIPTSRADPGLQWRPLRGN